MVADFAVASHNGRCNHSPTEPPTMGGDQSTVSASATWACAHPTCSLSTVRIAANNDNPRDRVFTGGYVPIRSPRRPPSHVDHDTWSRRRACRWKHSDETSSTGSRCDIHWNVCSRGGICRWLSRGTRECSRGSVYLGCGSRGWCDCSRELSTSSGGVCVA